MQISYSMEKTINFKLALIIQRGDHSQVQSQAHVWNEVFMNQRFD